MQSTASIFDQGAFPSPAARFNMAAHTLAMASKNPDKVALEVVADPQLAPQCWTYGAIKAAVRGTMTGLLRTGIGRGDRVLLRLGNSPDFAILFFAATGIGALPVPLSPQLTPPEVQRLSDMLAPALVCTGDGTSAPHGVPVLPPETYRPFRALEPAEYADTGADDPAYIIFTSGTGGSPKGVVHAHRAAWARRMMWRDWYGLGPDDRVLHAGAFNWTYTLGTGLTDPWAAGATAIIHTGPPAREVWAEIAAARRPTILAAAPGVYRQLLAAAPAAGAFASLRHGLSAGEALPASTQAAWHDATGTTILGALGMSEVSTYISASPDRPDAARPQPGRRVAILEPARAVPVPRGTPGRLAVSRRDPGLMLGYWRRDGAPDLPLEGEWFVTGDRATMADDDAITHLGRTDDMMSAGGYRVAPAEVETVLLSHPSVAEAAVVALPVRDGVEIVAAFVVARESVTAEALRAHCALALARYKCPREVRFLDALPRTATGKVQRRALIAAHGWKGHP